MAVQPISPSEVAQVELSFPDEVIESFNELIAKNYHRGSASFKANQVIQLIKSKGLKGDPFTKHWLDVEPLYQKLGWLVEYHQPDRDESYDAYFIFRMKKP